MTYSRPMVRGEKKSRSQRLRAKVLSYIPADRFESVDELVERMGVNRSRVYSVLRGMAESGLIERQEPVEAYRRVIGGAA